jgi:cysteine-rich repeat protein
VLEYCGDGLRDPGEECDDGNTAGGDGCSADCVSQEICGNRYADVGEECDTAGATAACDADCSLPVWGTSCSTRSRASSAIAA